MKSQMTFLILNGVVLFYLSSFSPNLNAGETLAGKSEQKKKSPSTQVYEKEKNEKSLIALVKVYREIQGQFEVSFDQLPGFFTVDEGTDSQSVLSEAAREKTPVSVKIDLDSRRVLSAQARAPQRKDP